MSVNKLALNKISEDFLNIELELMDTLDHNSSKDDINAIVDDVSESIRQHLFFLVKQRVEEQAKIKKNIFSNFNQFSQPVSSTSVKNSNSFTKGFEKKVNNQQVAKETLKNATLPQVIHALKKVDVIIDSNSYLPNVYRFKNSPYAYTIDSIQWSSPFGSFGENSLDLVNDISRYILKYDDTTHNEFIIIVANAL